MNVQKIIYTTIKNESGNHKESQNYSRIRKITK